LDKLKIPDITYFIFCPLFYDFAFLLNLIERRDRHEHSIRILFILIIGIRLVQGSVIIHLIVTGREVVSWIRLAQGGFHWQAVVNTVTSLRIP